MREVRRTQFQEGRGEKDTVREGKEVRRMKFRRGRGEFGGER